MLDLTEFVDMFVDITRRNSNSFLGVSAELWT